MTVRPLNLDGLVRVPARGLDVARSAAARLGDLDQRVDLKLAPFGAVSLRCLDVAAPCRPDDSDVTWTLSRDRSDGRSGYLILDGLAALRIVAATLGLPAPRALRFLGSAERGIATATIATLLRAAARDVSVAMGSRTWRAQGLARLMIGIDFGTFFERVRLDIPPEWLPPRTGTSLITDATRRELGIPLIVELARTTVTASDWSRARPGDAVVFDEWTALGRGRDWPARIICGEFSAEVMIGPDGRATMASDFRASNETNTITTDSDDIRTTGRDMMSSDDRQAASVAMLAAAPIQIVAEIGRLVLRADEITTLRSGSILAIGPLSPTIVDLRVGDRRWARGELVDVDGQLGVRVTTLLPEGQPRIASAEAETLR